MSAIKTIEMQVTPDIAKEWLATHWDRVGKGVYRQRPLTDSKVEQYSDDMKSGQWLLCPQPITFDIDGNLMDGQHRLEAVVKSGATVAFMISSGWPSIAKLGTLRNTNTMDTIDRGRTRSVAQQMQLHGITSAAMVASCAAFAVRINNAGKTPGMSFANTTYILENLGLGQHVDKISSLTSVSKDLQGRFIGPLAYYHTAYPRKAEEFARNVFEGTTEKDTGPYLWLRWQKIYTQPPLEERLRALSACLRYWHNTETPTRVMCTPEALRWLADINPKLRDGIKARFSL